MRLIHESRIATAPSPGARRAHGWGFAASVFGVLVVSASVAAVPVVAAWAPVWLPVAIGVAVPVCLTAILIAAWTRYARAQYTARQRAVVYELRVTQDGVHDEQYAMQQLIAALSGAPGHAISRWQRLFHGRVPPWWSFELVSEAGSVHLYLWMWESVAEETARVVSEQYPAVELHQVHDHVAQVTGDRRANVWGYRLRPDEATRDMEHGEVSAFLMPRLIATLSSLSSGERAVVQLLVAPHTPVGAVAADFRVLYQATSDAYRPERHAQLLAPMHALRDEEQRFITPTDWYLARRYPRRVLRRVHERRANRAIIRTFRERSWPHDTPARAPVRLPITAIAVLLHVPQRAQWSGLARGPQQFSSAPDSLPY